MNRIQNEIEFLHNIHIKKSEVHTKIFFRKCQCCEFTDEKRSGRKFCYRKHDNAVTLRCAEWYLVILVVSCI